MKEFNFEYTDTKFLMKLFGICSLVFVGMIITAAVNKDTTPIIWGLILSFIIPFAIYFLNKKNITKLGTACITDASVTFQLTEVTQTITFEEIATYQVEQFNGTSLKLKLNNGTEFKLLANTNFCNADQFDAFCQEFEQAILQFKTTNNTEITRKKTIFEQAWMLPFLVILSVGLVGMSIFALANGKNIPASFFTSAALLIPMWIAYFNAKRKKEIN
ncbi:MAG: hypothetical protein JHD28_04030 [Bacteroidia bacterium]|nr:hypothetical protein [Bacteroidia bacterium]